MSKKTGQSGNDVKESIVVLCRLFKYGDIFEKITPEHIRQAKFDKPDVVDTLLKLLYRIINGNCNKTMKDQTKSILSKLKTCKYPRLHHVQDKTGKILSSREVLLAITWYMHIAKTADSIRNKATKPVDILNLLKLKQSFIKGPLKEKSSLSSVQQANRISWQMSQIRLLSNQISSIEAANTKQMYKVAHQAKDAELKENPLLLFLMRYPSLITEYEKSLERKSLLLQTLIRWKDLESVFWGWMGSVVSAAPIGTAQDPASFDIETVENAICSLMSRSMTNVLEKKMIRLQEELNLQKKEYLKNFGKRSDLLATLQPEQRVEIDRELSNLKRKLVDAFMEPTLKCVKGDSETSPKPNQVKLDHILEQSIPVTWECERLRNVNSLLGKDIKMMRLEACERLTALSQRFPGVILIPPIVPQSNSRV